MNNRIPAPAPGVYLDVPFHTYLKWDAASNSGLKELRRSPAHFKARCENGDQDTQAKLIGRATHCAILEPDHFEKRFAIGPEELRSNADKGKKAELELRYGPGHVLRPKEFELCLRIRDGVHRYTAAHNLLNERGPVEVSVVWIDPETGALCKARYDKLAYETAGGTVVDLKSTEDASEEAFARSTWNYRYDCQGALYLDGAEANSVPVRYYTILAYEKEPPFGVGLYVLDEGTLSAGEQEVRPLLALYQQCKERNEWPGYPDRVRDLALPAYAWNRINAQEIGA